MAPRLLGGATMSLRVSMFVLIGGFAIACGGAVADAPSEPELEIPTNVPKSSSSSPRSSTGAAEASSDTACPSIPFREGNYCEESGDSVWNVDDLRAILANISWAKATSVSTARGTVLPGAHYLYIGAAIELAASDLPAADCDDCQTPYFRTGAFPELRTVSGVTCIEEAPEQPVAHAEPACARIAIAKGTALGFRPVVQDMHPSGPTYWPFVDFTPSCTSDCGEGGIWVDSSNCFTSAYNACAYGEGLSPSVCACRADACHQKPNGTACEFSSSPDVEVTGTCSPTGCVPR